MAHVFISYSTQDRAYALKLAKRLKDEGIAVWIDNAQIRSGDDWWQSIVEALQAASAVIVVMTPAASQSEWVKRETLLAEQSNKRIFPILVEGENWPLFVHIQYSDVRKSGGFPPKAFFEELRVVLQIEVRMEEQKKSPEANMPEKKVKLQPSDTIRAAWIGAVALLLAAIIAFIAVALFQNNRTSSTPTSVQLTASFMGTATPVTQQSVAGQPLVESSATVIVIVPTISMSQSETFVVNVARGRGIVVLTVERPTALGDLVIDFGNNERYRLGAQLADPLVTDVLCIRQAINSASFDPCTEANTLVTENTGNSWRNAEIVFTWRGSEIDRCVAQPAIDSGLYECGTLSLTS